MQRQPLAEIADKENAPVRKASILRKPSLKEPQPVRKDQKFSYDVFQQVI